MQKLLQNLASVCWSPSQATSTLLTSHQIKHGFCGIDTPHPPEIHYVKQVHGTKVLRADAQLTSPHTLNRSEADGIWSDQKNLAVAIRTADCLPVLFAASDDKNYYKYVMAVHAGWRGLVSGILPQAVKVLREQNPQLKFNSLVACIGPAISREQFEIGPEVIAEVLDKKFDLDITAVALTISKGRGDRWHLDLATAAALQLMQIGIDPPRIEVIQACTKSSPNEWHSYRREGKGCGVNWSWISTF